MIPPINCPYKGLTASPCWSCENYLYDTDECKLNYLAVINVNHTNANHTGTSDTYEERLSRYERDRVNLLKLSKETLVDLILKKPNLK